MRLICFLLAWLLAGPIVPSHAAAADPAVIAAEQRRIEVVQTVAPSVVAIFAQGGAGGGSGVLIGPDGFALTNFHVVNPAGSFMKCGLNDGVLYDAVIVGIDPTGDVALVQLLGRDDFPHARLGDSDALQVGDWVYAMGNPFLLATDFQPTVTYGIVSGVHRYQYPAGTFLEYADCIQVDTSINPGNSGGPLFNDAGELVGINGRISVEARGRVNSGAGYAISINQIKHFMDHLRSGRIVDHATLGATVTSANDGSVIVDGILEQSEAYRRGLRIEDEIVSFAGRPIRSVNQFKNILGIYPNGWVLPLVFQHEGERHEIFVRLRALHRKTELTPGAGRQRRPSPKPEPKQPPDQRKDGPPDGKPPREKPAPSPHESQAAPPEKHKHMFVSKDGFANYYFNQLEQQRLLRALDRLGDYSKQTGTWLLHGKTDKGDNFQFTLADKGLGMELGRRAYFQPLDGTNLVDEPPSTGGLLVALYHLKLLSTQREKAFTEFYYLGSEPLDGRGVQVDVLVSTLTGVESRWYFSGDTGTFVGFDTRLDPDVDECAVRFGAVRSFEGLQFPEQITVRSGDRDFATFEFDRAEFRSASSVRPAVSEK